MPVRNFNGSSDVITCTPPSYYNGDWTHASVLRRTVVGNFHSYYTLASDHGQPDVVLGFLDSNGAELVWQESHAAHLVDTTLTWATTSWQLVVHSFDNDAANDGLKLTCHKFDGTTWGHSGTDSTVGTFPGTGPANWVAGGNPVLRFGNWNSSFNWFQGRMARQALWVGTAFDNTQVEALAGGTLDNWAALGATHIWPFGQANTSDPVLDYVGNADQIAISGTSVVTDDDPPTSIIDMTTSGGETPGDNGYVRVGGVWVPFNRKVRVAGSWV